MRIVARIAAVMALAVLIAGYGGAVHPLGDSLALLRLPAGITLLFCMGFAGGSRWLRLAGVTSAVLAVGGVAGQAWLPGQAGGFAVYQKNLWAGNVAHIDLVADIEESGADIVLLQEVSDRNFPLLERLEGTFPHQHFCRFSASSGMAVLSRFPATGPGICSDRRGMAGLQVEFPDGPIWALSMHLYWPYPHGQRAQADRLLTQIEGLDGPFLMGGDFNMVPWGSTVRDLAEATGTTRAGPLFPTLVMRRVPLPIDMVFAPGGGQAERRPRLGSDHYGVLARVALAQREEF